MRRRADSMPCPIAGSVACPADARGRLRPTASRRTGKPSSQPASRPGPRAARPLLALAIAGRPLPTPATPIPPR